MKIAYLIGALNRGGLESLILDICRQLKQVPYNFICIYRHEGNMTDDFLQSGAELIHIPNNGMMLYLHGIRKRLLSEHVTIVHSQTPSNTLLLSIALLGTGIKIVTTLHGYSFSYAAWWQRELVYRNSERILCVSNHQKAVYEQKWKLPKENKLQVVYNGIDFSKIDDVKNERVSELVSERINLTMVGNFGSVRSQIVLCKAIDKLKEQGILDFDFYFVGKRVEREEWRYDECAQYCKEHQLENVRFLGSRGDVPELLKSMDGFVYSSASDTFGIAVIEAIAAGLPVVVNDWDVMKEVCNLGLSDTNHAIRYFKTEDIDNCAEQIKNLLADIRENGNQLRKDALDASERAKNKYSILNHIKKLNEVYQAI